MFVAKQRVLDNCMKLPSFVVCKHFFQNEACFLAVAAHLCHFTIHLLHHCHLQAELEEDDRGGMLGRASEFPQSVTETKCIFKSDFICYM